MIQIDIRILSFIILTVAAFIIITLERLFPYNKSQPIIREGFWNDFVLYNFIQTFLVGIFIAYIIEFIDNSTKLSRMHLIAEWPIALQLLFFLVTHDLYIYWFHKLQHKNKYLWRLHEAHHSPKVVDWLSGVRSHSFEILINQTVEFLPTFFIRSTSRSCCFKRNDKRNLGNVYSL